MERVSALRDIEVVVIRMSQLHILDVTARAATSPAPQP